MVQPITLSLPTRVEVHSPSRSIKNRRTTKKRFPTQKLIQIPAILAFLRVVRSPPSILTSIFLIIFPLVYVVVQVDQDNGQLQSLDGLNNISVEHRLAVINHLHICLLNGVPRDINTVRGFKGGERNKPANRTSSENSSQGLIPHLVAPAN